MDYIKVYTNYLENKKVLQNQTKTKALKIRNDEKRNQKVIWIQIH